MTMRCLAFLFLATAQMAAAGQVRGVRGAAPSPAAAPAPGPAVPSMESTTVETEIKNMNYYDMTKTWKDPLGNAAANPNDWMMEMGDDAPKKNGDDAPKKNDDDAPKKEKKTIGAEGPEGSADEAPPSTDPIGEMLGEAPPNPEAEGPVDDSPPTGGNPETEDPVDDSPAGDGPKAGGPLDEVLTLGALPWPAKGTSSLLQAATVAKSLSTLGTITVQNALRTAIEAAIKETLGCNSPSSMPGPAPAPAPALPPAPLRNMPPSGVLPAAPAAVALVSLPPWGNGPPPTATFATPQAHFAPAQALPSPAFLRASPAPGAAPGPAPGPAATCAMPKVHVGFFPGKKMKKKHLLNSPPIHATVLVKVSLFERPGNGFNDLAGVEDQLKQAVATGDLLKKLAVAIHAVTGVMPELSAIKVQTTLIKLWDVQKCGGHMNLLVKSFALHYTRRQVPMALYNECTNFATKMSFSHDYILDPRDAARCRKATAKFAKRWKLGEIKNPTYFEPMCQRFCEAKFGEDAPQCQFE